MPISDLKSTNLGRQGLESSDQPSELISLAVPIKSIIEDFHATHEELNLPETKRTKQEGTSKQAIGDIEVDLDINGDDENIFEKELMQTGIDHPVPSISSEVADFNEEKDCLCHECVNELQPNAPLCCISSCHELANSTIFSEHYAKILRKLIEKRFNIDIDVNHKADSLNEDLRLNVTGKRKRLKKAEVINRNPTDSNFSDLNLNLPSIGLTEALGKVLSDNLSK